MTDQTNNPTIMNRRSFLRGAASAATLPLTAPAMPVLAPLASAATAAPALLTTAQLQPAILALHGMFGHGYADNLSHLPQVQSWLRLARLSRASWQMDLHTGTLPFDYMQLGLNHPMRWLLPYTAEHPPNADYTDHKALHATFAQHIASYEHDYRTAAPLFDTIRRTLRQHPHAFTQACDLLAAQYPEAIRTSEADSREKIPLENFHHLLKEVRRGTQDLDTPQQAADRIWSLYGRITGNIPPEASAAARQHITEFIAQPGYKPVHSLAQLNLEDLKRSANHASCRVRKSIVQMPLYMASDLTTAVASRPVETYRLTQPQNAPHRCNLQALGHTINQCYPLEPGLSTAFTHDCARAMITETPRLGETLLILEPPPELAAWLDTLMAKQPRPPRPSQETVRGR